MSDTFERRHIRSSADTSPCLAFDVGMVGTPKTVGGIKPTIRSIKFLSQSLEQVTQNPAE